MSPLLYNGLHLFALTGFAIAQPIFDLLERNAAFFVSHHCRPPEILALILILSLLPSCAALLLEAGARAISPQLMNALHLGFVGLLSAATGLPPLSDHLGSAAALATAACVGIAAASGYARFAPLRSFVSILGLAPIVFAIRFAATPGMSRILFQGGSGAPLQHSIRAEAPVVVVVFDELATTSILGADGQIDAVRAPAFAALARRATWYPNATAIHTSTIHAVSALLTGNLPSPELYPTLSDHPRNLFSLLENHYDMHVVESETMLYRGSEPSAEMGSAGQRLARVLSDLRFIYLHRLLPSALTAELPAVDQTWKNFAERPRELDFAEQAVQTIWLGYDEPQERFERFIEEIGPCEARCFHFIHTTLPHKPWDSLPSGRRYSPATIHGLAEKEVWGEDPWEVAEGYQQHLLQVAAADRLLGRLLARLESVGLYERALIAVVADHGVSFWPGESMRRFANTSHPADMIRVPLLIKAPHQKSGALDTHRVSTLDLLPMVAEAIDQPVPWPLDGCAPRTDGCSERDPVLSFDQASRRITLSTDELDDPASLEHKLALFGSGVNGRWPFQLRLPELANRWVGKRVADLPVETTENGDYRLRLAQLPIDRAATQPEHYSPARLSGHLQRLAADAQTGDTSAPQLVIAVDGRVEAVVPSYPRGLNSFRFSAFVPEERLAGSEHTLDFYVATKDAAQLSHAHRLRLRLRLRDRRDG